VTDGSVTVIGVHSFSVMQISSHVTIPDSEIDIHAMRSQGAGGQNVNKVSTAIHLRFDIMASSLPPFYKEELLKLKDHRISQDGIITIKAQQYRTQERNREDALERLRLLIQSVAIPRSRQARRPGLKAHGSAKNVATPTSLWPSNAPKCRVPGSSSWSRIADSGGSPARSTGRRTVRASLAVMGRISIV